MNRDYYNRGSPTPFLYPSGEGVDQVMECLQVRHQPTGPFHYLISEQAKSLVALQELQHEVGALLEFRDLVIETFPHLRTKLQQASSTPTTMTSPHHHHSNIPVSIRAGDWTPGVRVRKKLGSKEEARSNGKKNDAVQDSGFSTETSSKETHSASSTAPSQSNAIGVAETDEAEDELWNLLDVIHRKGTRLKDEVEALQGAIRDQNPVHQEKSDFQRVLFHASADDVRQIRQERDLLMDRLAEMEAEVLASRVHTSRLQEDLENLLTAKQDLEEQLKVAVTQRGEVNSRIHDLHSQFVTKSASSSPDSDRHCKGLIGGDIRKDSTSSQRQSRKSSKSALDSVFTDRIPKVKAPDAKKLSAILKEHDPLVLQKHLLITAVQNQVLKQQVDSATRLEVGLVDKLDKAREENEELRFQLEDKNIELEGTRARVRMLEQFQASMKNSTDAIHTRDSESPERISRNEITTASMKNMSPLPMNLQMDHSSSTESAHDQAENNRKGQSVTDPNTRRKPSKIPLKSYTAPKPPGGKQNSSTHSARSRSGDSPGRPHSAQSWRNKSEGNSLSGTKSNNSLPKSRNGSLVTSKDSLSNKLRSSDSLSRLSSPNSFSNNGSQRTGTLRKSSSPSRWNQQQQQQTSDKVRPKSTSSFWNFFKLRDNAQT